MGRAVSSSLEPKTRRTRVTRSGPLILGMSAIASLTLWLVCPATAQDANAGARPGQSANASDKKAPEKLVIDADQLVYDKDKNTVSAIGSVQLFYQGRILQADRVTYNRTTKRVYAEGHAKMTDEHGDVVYGSRFELSDNFRDGFIDSVQMLTSDKTRFSSPRVERTNGDITVLRKAAYTACEPCKNHPERPPFWQVRATRIIENQVTHTVYYEDAQLLFWGVPFFWMPYFSSPDSTVNKQTGVLAPQFVQGASLGYGIGIPYFINLAPNYDLTLIPTYLSKQGLLGEADWRQRLTNGTYNIRVTGIDEQEPGLFPLYPYGAGNSRLRGSIESKGDFLLNDMWRFGWNGTWMSDKFFLNDYKLQGIDFSDYYFQDVVSSIYLRGQAAHSYFDLSAYRFVGTTPNDDNRTLPIVAPVLDFNRVINLPDDRTYGLGGQLTVDSNVANIDRTNAAFQSTGLQTFDNAYHLYNVCETQVANAFVPTYVPGKCLLRGIAGDYARASGQVSWQRSYIDPIGEVWKPFLFARLDGESTQLDETGSITYASFIGSSTVANSSQAAFFSGSQQGSFARGMAGIGLEYQFPFTYSSSWGTQTITPIGQFIARPNEILPRIQPNEDFAKPRLRRDQPVRMEQVLGLRPGRRRHAPKLRRPIYRRLRQRRPRQCRGRPVDPGRGAEFLHAGRCRQHGPEFGTGQDAFQFCRRRDVAAVLDPDLRHHQAAVRQRDPAARPFRRDRESQLRRRDRQRRLRALCGSAGARLGISARGPDHKSRLQIQGSLVV